MLWFCILLAFIANLWLSWNIGLPISTSWGISLPGGFIAFLVSMPIVLLMALSGGLALGIVGMIFGKHDDRTNGQRFIRSFLRGWWWLTVLLWFFPWISFGVVQFTNTHVPATLPRITLTNGTKTVIFQSMMHIASPGFYEDIKKDMNELQKEDYIFFYEGVKKGSNESIDRLSQLMWTEISPEMYDILAQIGDLTFQGDESYIGIMPSINVDLSTDEIVDLANKSRLQKPSTAPMDIAALLRKKYPELSPLQKSILKTLARGSMNLLLREYTHADITTELKKTIPVFSIILDKRNEKLAQAIIDSPNTHIYIHYGAMHFAWVLANLQKNDPNWKEIERSSLIVIR